MQEFNLYVDRHPLRSSASISGDGRGAEVVGSAVGESSPRALCLAARHFRQSLSRGKKPDEGVIAQMMNEVHGFTRRKFVAGGAGLLAAAGRALGQRGSYSDSSFAGGPISSPSGRIGNP